MERRTTLRLHVPEPKHRPGEPADFSDLHLPKAGSVERPPIDSPAFAVRDLAYTPICVLDDEAAAIGPSDPKLDVEILRRLNRIAERPVVRNIRVAVRKMMNLSSSFDHRVVDGWNAASFTQGMKRLLEEPATLFLE